MLAVSHSGDKVFLHQPESGLAVPVLLNLEKGLFCVAVPSPYELENDYAVFEELGEAVRAAGRGKRKPIELARKFSELYSQQFKSQIASGELTVAALRKLVERHFARHAGENTMLASVETRLDEEGLEFSKPAMAG